jgi:hypothetical protein
MMIDTESDPGSYADALAHSPCLRVEDYNPSNNAGRPDEAKP